MTQPKIAAWFAGADIAPLETEVGVVG